MKKKNTNKIYKDQFELVLELKNDSVINRLLDPDGDSLQLFPVKSGKTSILKNRSKNKENNLILTKLKKPR